MIVWIEQPRLALRRFACANGTLCASRMLQIRSFKGLPPGKNTSRKLMAYEKLKRKNQVRSFDNLLHKEKPLRRFLLLKNALARQPECAMPAYELARQLDDAGLMVHSKALTLLARYPSAFKLTEKAGWKSPLVEFTDEARALVDEETKLNGCYESLLVEKVTKLLMMASDRQLPLDHVCLLERELGLPHDFRTRIVHEYPDCFKVVEIDDDMYLQLTNWDPSLAYTTRELNHTNNPLLDRNRRPLPLGFPLSFAKGHRLGPKGKKAMESWQTLDFISPYENCAGTDSMSPAHGKRAVAVLHEFLSLTLEKLSTLEVIDLLRKQYHLPCRLLYFVHKHYGIFYCTQKANRHAVFLKEAYRALDDPKKVAHLIEKPPQLELNEKYEKLMQPPKSKQIPGLGREKWSF